MRKGRLLVVGVLLFLGGVAVGVYLERGKVFDRRGTAPVSASDDTATLLVGKWQREDGTVTEFTADGRYSSPEIKTMDGVVVQILTTWGTYRVTAPRHLEMRYRLEGLEKKPEFIHQVEVKELSPDRLVYRIDSGGYGDTWTTVTLKRIKD